LSSSKSDSIFSVSFSSASIAWIGVSAQFRAVILQDRLQALALLLRLAAVPQQFPFQRWMRGRLCVITTVPAKGPMQIKNFKDMYTELQELVSMESQIDIALKRMADALR
jgi:hypothetical protein